MKLATVVVESQNRAAVAVGESALFIPSLAAELLPGSAALPTDLKSILAMPDGLLKLRSLSTQASRTTDAVRSGLREKGALVDQIRAKFAAPIPDPLHFMGCGASYHQHLREMGNVPVPAHPVIFLCSPASLNGHNCPITIPAVQADMIDYEGELAIVIGRPCYGVGVADALAAVAGYVVHNDISARDHVAEVKAVQVPTQMLDAWGRNIAGKQHPGFSPMGPWLVTADEIPDPHALRLITKVNGRTVQDIGTDDLIFTVAEYIAYVAQWYPLQPGDIISTGTPGGVGVAKNPPEFLSEGDRVEVSITGLGTLANTLVRG